MLRIGLIGDYNATVTAHQAIPLALDLAKARGDVAFEYEWIPTESIVDASSISAFDGLWCVPASPYRSMAGALTAIKFARENARPFLGTCGGFQHLVIEYARNVLGWENAEHSETTPDAERAVIAPLVCSLVEVNDVVRFQKGTRIASIYQSDESHEGYHCNYGLNPAFAAALLGGPLHASAFDHAGEVRAVELDGHPFFVGTLFQPERAALAGKVPPLVEAFVQACENQAS